MSSTRSHRRIGRGASGFGFAAGAFSRRRRQEGLSLIELIVVTAVIGITLGMGAPYLIDEIRKAKIRGITDQVVALFQSARIEAIRKNAQVTIDVSDEGVTAPGIRSVDFVSLAESDLEWWDQADCYTGYKQLPLVYDAQGKADDKRSVCLADQRGNIFQIAVDSLQGTPRVRKFLLAGDAPGAGGPGFYLDGWRWY